MKRNKVLAQMKHQGGDFVFMQETRLSKMEHEKLAKLFNAQVFYSSDQSSRRGVITMDRNQIPFEAAPASGGPLGGQCSRGWFEVESTTCDKEGRYVFVVGKIDGEFITLLNIYNPPEEGPGRIEKIIDLITVQSKGVIVLGDFNFLMNERMDTQSPTKHKAQKDALLMRKFAKDIGMVDIWRTLNPSQKDYTCYSSVTGNYSRLDYFFMFSNDIATIRSIKNGQIHSSDHAPLQISLSTGKEKNAGTWRFDNSLLWENEFKIKVKRVLQDYITCNDTEDVNPVTLWEGAKAVIRGDNSLCLF